VLLFSYLLIEFWPVPRSNGSGWESTETLWIVGPVPVIDEIRLLLLVILAAGVGSYIHAATSFATYVGNKSFVVSWTWWYVLRPFIGMALALVFYFVIRGGLLSVQSNAADFNPYGIAAVAGLVGIFSKQATDKLEEVFTNLFRTAEGAGDDERRDKLGGAVSVIDAMVPLKKIKKAVLAPGQTDSDINLAALFKVIDEGYTRVPIFDANDVCKYIVHQSLFYKFVARRSMGASPPQNMLANLTLKDFLAFGDVAEYVADAIAAVPETATLDDAQAAMEKIEYCQDVLVTTNGERKGTVVGWLTNVDLARHINP
jgi:hypothetical protein